VILPVSAGVRDRAGGPIGISTMGGRISSAEEESLMVRRGRYRRVALAAVIAAVSLVVGSGPATAHETCGQPTHVWLATSPNVGTLVTGGPPLTVTTGITMIFTGVVHAGTPARWGLYDPVTQRRFFYTGQPARSNCVIHAEAEMVPASTIGVGRYEVWASVVRWEDNPQHADFSIFVGMLVVNQG